MLLFNSAACWTIILPLDYIMLLCYQQSWTLTCTFLIDDFFGAVLLARLLYN